MGLRIPIHKNVYIVVVELVALYFFNISKYNMQNTTDL